MSETGAHIQQFNMELVKRVESLKFSLNEIHSSIKKDELYKAELIAKISELNSHLDKVNKNLDQKYKRRDKCQRTIDDAQEGLSQIAQTAKLLLENIESTKDFL